MARLKNAELEALRSKHPGLRLFTAAADAQDVDAVGEDKEPLHGDDYAFRPCRKAEYTAHKVMLAEGGSTAARAHELTARSLCVYPGPEAIDQLAENAPAVLDGIGIELLEDARAGMKIVSRKR